MYVWGVPVPSRFSWAPTLALTHLCVPQASFPAHIAGVVAGVIRAYCLEPGGLAAQDMCHVLNQMLWLELGSFQFLVRCRSAKQTLQALSVVACAAASTTSCLHVVYMFWLLLAPAVRVWWINRRRWTRSSRQVVGRYSQWPGQQQTHIISSSAVDSSTYSNVQQQSASSSKPQSEDWRLLHHQRWLQQQEDEQSTSLTSRRTRQPSSPTMSGCSVDLAVDIATEAAAAAAIPAHRSQHQPLSFGGDRLSFKRLLLDAGLQVALAATAAGLYFVMSKSERPNRGGFVAAPWRR